MADNKKEPNSRVVMVPVESESPLLGSELMSQPHSPASVASAENNDPDSPSPTDRQRKPKKHFEMIRMKGLIMKKEKEAQE